MHQFCTHLFRKKKRDSETTVSNSSKNGEMTLHQRTPSGDTFLKLLWFLKRSSHPVLTENARHEIFPLMCQKHLQKERNGLRFKGLPCYLKTLTSPNLCGFCSDYWQGKEKISRFCTSSTLHFLWSRKRKPLNCAWKQNLTHEMYSKPVFIFLIKCAIPGTVRFRSQHTIA